jgi:hypothetical protein
MIRLKGGFPENSYTPLLVPHPELPYGGSELNPEV